MKHKIKLFCIALMAANVSAFASAPVYASHLLPNVNIMMAQDEAPVDINQATVDQLMTLKHIGPKLAQNIVNFRTQNGPFAEVHDLIKVPGISEKLLADIMNDNPGRLTIGQ